MSIDWSKFDLRPDAPRLIFVKVFSQPLHLSKQIALPPESRTLVVRQDQRAGGVKHAADAMRDARAHGVELHSRVAAQLTNGLLDGEHAVHARMRVDETAAVRVQREVASLRDEVFFIVLLFFFKEYQSHPAPSGVDWRELKHARQLTRPIEISSPEGFPYLIKFLRIL